MRCIECSERSVGCCACIRDMNVEPPCHSTSRMQLDGCSLFTSGCIYRQAQMQYMHLQVSNGGLLQAAAEAADADMRDT